LVHNASFWSCKYNIGKLVLNQLYMNSWLHYFCPEKIIQILLDIRWNFHFGFTIAIAPGPLSLAYLRAEL
jgi:hypothetical protein